MSVKFDESVKICPQLRDRQLCEGLNLAEVGQATEGLTGADLRALLHTANLEAETELGNLIYLGLIKIELWWEVVLKVNLYNFNLMMKIEEVKKD